MTDQPRARRFRLTPFRVGFAAAAVPVLLAGGWTIALIQSDFDPKYTTEVLSHGGDVTRHGGAKVVVLNGQGAVLNQVCRDGCDDFEFQQRSGDNAFRVEVRDAAGQCVVCDPGSYVTTGVLMRWTVAGDADLAIQTSSITRNSDGTFAETVYDVQTKAGRVSHRKLATQP